MLVTLGCGTAMLVGCDAVNGGGYILTALAFGLVIVGMAYCVGNISGCHINPAVSLGVLMSGGLIIGFTLVLVHILGIGLTGTSVNPARSIGPAIVAAITGNTAPIACVWVFIVGPLVGAALAAVVYKFLESEK